MNAKEAAELRRRLQSGRHNITYILGCYVNENREIISTFRQSVGMMTENDEEKYLALLRKVLSGKMGRNLKDVVFTTRQVADSPEHRLLSALRDSRLQDEDAVQEFYRKVMDSLALEGNYLILLACNIYDVTRKGRDGEFDRDGSEEAFPHILCSICPVKQTKPTLSYVPQEQAFHLTPGDAVVAMPELGFLFPAFDDRSTNLYGALYYTRSIAENHQEFVDAVFHTDIAMPAAEQKEVFQSMLSGALGEDCRYEVVQTVHDKFSTLAAESRENHLDEPLAVDKATVRNLLEDCGVSEQHVAAFSVQYDENFGYDAQLSPDNLVDTKQFRLETPNVTIHVDPDRSDLVQTRVIDGAQYILIRVEEGVEVNGVNIHLEGEAATV
ncbi:MAG: DUF4317 domain-containing protein [Clostridiales bacterium]|nr:DUF4317 domain-containing protein [Clostridiales bacterium]